MAVMVTASAFAFQRVEAALPEIGDRPVGATVKARRLSVSAKAVGRDSRDMALAALYNRLFSLEDKKREAELTIDEAGLMLGDYSKAYSKLDRFVDTVKEIKEIAQNPRHRRYPNMTETRKLQILDLVLKQIRAQTLAGLNIRRIDRDIAKVERLIQEHLNRRP